MTSAADAACDVDRNDDDAMSHTSTSLTASPAAVSLTEPVNIN